MMAGEWKHGRHGEGDMSSFPLLSPDGRFEARGEAVGSDSHVVRIFNGNGRQLLWADVVDLWATDATFGEYYSRVLGASPFKAFFWECPPTTKASLNRQPFEHHTVEFSGFAPASPEDFQEHFNGATGGAVSFSNLGGDTRLVAPVRQGPLENYGHIAAFVRGASAPELSAFWAEVGTEMRRTLDDRGKRPTWLSTEGSGVPWLHVRLDPRPKYYHTAEYRVPVSYPSGDA